MNRADAVRASLNRVQLASLVVGLIGFALWAIGVVVDREQATQSYLVAYTYWLGLAAGCLALAMLHRLVGGNWGYATRRFFEAGSATMPLLLVLFVPIVLGVQHLYEWSKLPLPEFWKSQIDSLGLASAYQWLCPVTEGGDHKLEQKSVYLNVPFFILRAAVFFIAWFVLSIMINRSAPRPVEGMSPRQPRPLRFFSAAGLGVLGLTYSFAMIDWVMSTDAHWYSSIFGMMLGAGAGVTTWSIAIIFLSRLSTQRDAQLRVPKGVFNDLGSLLLAFLMLWAYMSFSQYLIIWSGNLPAEIAWYLRRLDGGWQSLALILVVFHFVVPFLLLLSYDIKGNPRQLGMIAAGLMVVHFVDLYWIITPSFGYETVRVHWLDAAALLGIGGVWMAMFTWRLMGKPFVEEIEAMAEAQRKEEEEHGHG